MILFKRVRESFARIEGREWALLFLETVGIVAGILIAFELNEWASSREIARRQHELLERLFDESESTVTVVRRDRESMNKLVDREKFFATMLTHQNSCPAEPMWRAVDTVLMYPSISVPSSVYQEIMGSGGLSSIEDPTVRESVSRFHSKLEWLNDENSYLRQSVRYTVPMADPRVTYDFVPGARDPEVSHYDRRALCNDHSFRNGMVDAVRNHVLVAMLDADLAQYAIKMCARIGSALHRQCEPPDGPLIGADAEATKQRLSQEPYRRWN
ncbi:MAG TPA: hypothetical protein VIV07_04290 [Sphingomicrobium sp.]